LLEIIAGVITGAKLLEPEVMDTWEEAVEYDAMDFTEVNTALPNE